MKQKKEKRFAFGRNWKRYIKNVGRVEIDAAKKSLSLITDGVVLDQASFLDIGSGSGLFSRAAFALGFGRVVSFDYDQDSVDATEFMKKDSGASDSRWVVSQGSVLDDAFMTKLGKHDVVYSWGVLHHTGDMWKAINFACRAVKPSGVLMLALYNDQGWISNYWKVIKNLYVSSPKFFKFLMLLVFWTYFGVGLFFADVLRGRNPLTRHKGDFRGMKFFTDVIDWVGGMPFEVATPSEVKDFLTRKGFILKQERLVGRKHGCNEFVFSRIKKDKS